MLGTVPNKALSIPKWQCADAEDSVLMLRKPVRFAQTFEGLCTPTHFPSSFLFHFAAFQQSPTFTARTLGRHWPSKIWKALRISMLCSLPSSVEREQLAHVLCCCFLLGLLLVITGLREAGSVKCTGDQLRSTIWSVASGLISRYSSLEGGSFKVTRKCPWWGGGGLWVLVSSLRSSCLCLRECWD